MNRKTNTKSTSKKITTHFFKKTLGFVSNSVVTGTFQFRNHRILVPSIRRKLKKIKTLNKKINN